MYASGLPELASVRGKLGLPVERDRHFVANRIISAYADEAREHGHIVTPCAVGRTIISPTSTSAGCSIANAIARAIAAGGIANFSMDAEICAFTFSFVMDSAKFVRVKPGETTVTRSLSPASCRKPSKIASTAIFVPAYTAMFGTMRWVATEAVFIKWPKPCLRKMGSASILDAQFVEWRDGTDASIAD
jgi:hypothetical protein